MSAERMLLAIGLDRETHILVARGVSIEIEIAANLVEDLGLDAVTDIPGLWVLTCHPRFVEHAGSLPYWDYSNRAQLRGLEEAEWDALKAGNPRRIYSLWDDIAAASPAVVRLESAVLEDDLEF